jgi:hypothetical protein
MFIKPKIEIVTSTPENDYACIGVDCTCCGEGYMFGVSLSGVYQFWAGSFVQDAFPEMPKQHREMLISGTCPECWDDMFKDCDNDEDYTL